MNSPGDSTTVTPLQSIGYPGEANLLNVKVQPLYLRDSLTEGSTIVIDWINGVGRSQCVLARDENARETEALVKYELRHMYHVETAPGEGLPHMFSSIRTFWDPTSRRILYLGKEFDAPAGADYMLCGYWQRESRPSPGHGRTWRIPHSENDFPRHHVTDPEMMFAAVGTRAGRVWIYELFSAGAANYGVCGPCMQNHC